MKKHYAAKRINQTFSLLITLIVLLTFSKDHAQANITMTGFVVDEAIQLSLAGTTVHIEAGPMK